VEETNEDGIASEFPRARYSTKDAANGLSHALQQADLAQFMHSLQQLARKHGVAAIARDAGLNRTGLYRSLSQDADPRLSTLVALLSALKLRMVVEPSSKDDAKDPPPRR
jgi:probable addiction module antidote protein